MDRDKIIDDAAAVVDMSGGMLSPGGIGMLHTTLRMKGANMREARIVSRRALFNDYAAQAEREPPEKPETQGEIHWQPGLEVRRTLRWDLDERIPADLCLIETEGAHGVIKNCAVREE